MELITIELRPHLQSCNIFIFLCKNIDSDKVEINLLEKNVIIKIGTNVKTLFLPDIKIVPSSLSSLTIKNQWICFRLQTQPLELEFGSFKREIVTNSQSQFKLDDKTEDENKIFLKGSECVIVCNSCKNILSKTVFFKRILPFPSIECDPSDWFCCKKNQNFISVLHPQVTDYFYGSFFSILHADIFKNISLVTKNSLLCAQCLLNVGVCVGTNSYKIWNCCIDYKLPDNVSVIQNASKPLYDFLAVIKDSICNTLGEEIILESCTGNQYHYMIIKVMDMQLSLLTEINAICNDNTIRLQQIKVVKVIYKYETNEIINKNYTNSHRVALPVLESGLQYLISSSKRFPESYRIAGDYYIGHINFKEFVH